MSMSPARQPLHILRKDLRHLWPETLVTIALLVAFGWSQSQAWLPTTAEFNLLSFAAGFLKFLLPVSWLVLTSRLIHDEELVGDRQFWTTRPYTWYSLLAGKLLYLALFVGLPFLLLQSWLLHHAGLYPTLAVPGLLQNVLFIAVAFLLPFVAIAAVTATFVRYASSVLGGVIYAFVVLGFGAYFWSDNLDAPGLNYVLGAIFVLFPVAATLIQYARRKTLIARLVLVALPLVFLVVAIAVPQNLLNAHHYPSTSIGSAVYNSDPRHQAPAGRLVVFQHKVQVEVPVDVSLDVMPEKSYVEIQRVRATVDGPNGLHYTSDWNAARAFFNQAQKTFVVPVVLPEDIYNKVHDKSVSLHLTLGLQTFLPSTPYTVIATEKPFPLPGHASCTLAAETGDLECRFPFANKEPAQVESIVHSGDCLNPGPQSAPAFGTLEPTPIPVGFSPVEILKARLFVGEQKVSLCPNSPVTVTSLKAGSFSRMAIDIPIITLEPYARRIPVKPVQDTPTVQ